MLIEGEEGQDTRMDHLGVEPWEVYVVKADADTLGKSASTSATAQDATTAPYVCGQATEQPGGRDVPAAGARADCC
ncbi:hypothetical protein [Streptosporangium sp. NPDC087985]|uniref:hypothetical protein n=1 Tax=Streptosporangium sp. NPDC087985 TaxID=3366196 RepID=UPI0037F76EAD